MSRNALWRSTTWESAEIKLFGNIVLPLNGLSLCAYPVFARAGSQSGSRR
jgi:hypothetical protein